MPKTSQRSLRLQYKRHMPSCDGERYLHIRYYQRHRNIDHETRWKQLLSPTKQKTLVQIQRNPWLVEILDALESIRSLWADFHIGSLPPILSWRCNEEIKTYLLAMYSTWTNITNGQGWYCDEETVSLLQGLSPAWSTKDREKIELLGRENRIFRRIQHAKTRDEVIARVLRSEGMILTFKTFFKHTKLLGSIMLTLRHLVLPEKVRPSMQAMLEECFSNPRGDNRVYIQCTDDLHHQMYQEAPPQEHLRYAYWQLCLFIIRHKEHLITGLQTPKYSAPSECRGWQIRLGKLAGQLGFRTHRILELQQEDPDQGDVRRHVNDERPPGIFEQRRFQHAVATRRGVLRQFRWKLDTPSAKMVQHADESELSLRVCLFLPLITAALGQAPGYMLSRFGDVTLVMQAFL
ncbi:hypothetical protein BU24DRAFT_360599, partial [Aaosphaeria arxii CBS 175.79]